MVESVPHAPAFRSLGALSGEAYRHPAEDSRWQGLCRLPKVIWLGEQVTRYAYERHLRLGLLAGAVRVGPGGLQALHERLTRASTAFDVSTPECFVQLNPQPVCRLLGNETPLLILTSGLLDLLDENELDLLLARQAAHIHCGHLPRLTLWDFARSATHQLGLVGRPLAAAKLGLEEWRRAAELSVDRGAWLARPETALHLRLLAKLAGGRAAAEVNPQQLVEQAREFADATRGLSLGRVYRTLVELDDDQSFAVLRAAELNAWAQSPAAEALLAGRPAAAVCEQPLLWGAFASDGNEDEPLREEEPQTPVRDGLQTAARYALKTACFGVAAARGVVRGAGGLAVRLRRRTS